MEEINGNFTVSLYWWFFGETFLVFEDFTFYSSENLHMWTFGAFCKPRGPNFCQLKLLLEDFFFAHKKKLWGVTLGKASTFQNVYFTYIFFQFSRKCMSSSNGNLHNCYFMKKYHTSENRTQQLVQCFLQQGWRYCFVMFLLSQIFCTCESWLKWLSSALSFEFISSQICI